MPGFFGPLFLPSNFICCKVAHCALVRFLPSVNENVCLQIAFYIERLVALWAHVFFYIFFVGLQVLPKALSA